MVVVGYGWTGTVSECYEELLSWCGWCTTGLRYHKVIPLPVPPDFPAYSPVFCPVRVSVFVFMLTLSYSRETFLALQTWLADCRALASPDIVIILVGNKSDSSAHGLTSDIKSFANDFRGGEIAGGFNREREVSVEEAGRWASREGTISSTPTLLPFVSRCLRRC